MMVRVGVSYPLDQRVSPHKAVSLHNRKQVGRTAVFSDLSIIRLGFAQQVGDVMMTRDTNVTDRHFQRLH